MKVMTVLGTRPEIIRLSRVIAKLDAGCDHVLVHTGQNYDERLGGIFFDELKVRRPDHYLGVRGDGFADQVAQILTRGAAVLKEVCPDRVLVLGDTNSGLVAYIAAREGIPVYHMEAGNRCYDDRVPEEINRRVIDHCSTVLMPYTERSRANLLREGIPGERVYVTGNPILEVISHYDTAIRASTVLARLGLKHGEFLLVTLHRAENVDIEERLSAVLQGLDALQRRLSVPVVVSTHPRTRARMQAFGIASANPAISFMEPFGFPDFVALERSALCVLSDSGTVQEECCLFRVPNVTLRDVTERPETIECGSNMLSGADPDAIVRCTETVLRSPRTWTPPIEYTQPNVSDTVTKLVLGFRPASDRSKAH
ncbi:MAG: non-hydrolyzing UDP-N-acetylglucosamine 2-epimerase [Anaerolineae bacterium]